MMRLYNTLTRREEDFAPLRDNTVRMYTCGLTVYNRGHIGNFRSFVCLDVLRRALKYQCGYQVRQVTNFTDVDDKTIAGAQNAGLPLREFTDRYITAFREDAGVLGLEPAEETPRATDEANLRAMTDLITSLERNGHMHRSDGSIYFKISTFADYGKLARTDHGGISRAHASTPIRTPKKMCATSCSGKPPVPMSPRGISARAPAVQAGIWRARRWRCGCSTAPRSISMQAAST